MKLLLAGDVHGNVNHLISLFRTANNLGVDRIVQLGDFGYWEHRQSGVEFLEVAEQCVIEYQIPLFWVDGNHENHEMLNEYPIQDDGFRKIRSGVYHIPRGTIWEWDNVTFLGFGGAYSIDERSKTKFVSWWPNEEASTTEVQETLDKLRSDGCPKVDVMLTHDAPNEINIEGLIKNIWQSNRSRDKISAIFNAAKPKRLYHGHYHVRYSAKHFFDMFEDHASECLVEGLDCDGGWQFEDSYILLDTTTIV